ncbi:MAG: class I SAM-dependent rRNA methyltransferase [Armatimonadetes bacterium]|nr:class I SAM-dependent rRNA methyltransferase [Armatimonadota bacterium]
MARVLLKPKRDKSVKNRHPWIFSGAVQEVRGEVSDGDIVEVADSGNNWLARGYYNSRSQIVVRLLTWDDSDRLDAAFFRKRVREAVERRRDLLYDPQTNAFRLVFSEADRLPGLVADLYGDFVIVQCDTLGIERWKDAVLDTLMETLSPRGVFERSDTESRHSHEGLAPSVGLRRGKEPPPLVSVRERGIAFDVDIRQGQKTGFYLDQRENRIRAARFCAGKDVLDAFAYTGGFAAHALAAGAARITLIDSSESSLSLAERNLARIQTQGKTDYLHGNVFQALRDLGQRRRRYDVVILDPPKLAPAQGAVERAARGYKDLNLHALRLLRPGGILVTFSCSGLVDAALFQKVVFGASADTGRAVQILYRLSQSPDHPVLLFCPESEYLKGLICRAID